jgi:hypothetical protein
MIMGACCSSCAQNKPCEGSCPLNAKNCNGHSHPPVERLRPPVLAAGGVFSTPTRLGAPSRAGMGSLPGTTQSWQPGSNGRRTHPSGQIAGIFTAAVQSPVPMIYQKPPVGTPVMQTATAVPLQSTEAATRPGVWKMGMPAVKRTVTGPMGYTPVPDVGPTPGPSPFDAPFGRAAPLGYVGKASPFGYVGRVVNPSGATEPTDDTIARRPAGFSETDWASLTTAQRTAVLNNKDAQLAQTVTEAIKLGLGSASAIVTQAFTSGDAEAARKLQERLATLKSNSDIELAKIKSATDIELAKIQANLQAQVGTGQLTQTQAADLLKAALDQKNAPEAAPGFLDTTTGKVVAGVAVAGAAVGIYVLATRGRDNPEPKRRENPEPFKPNYFQTRGGSRPRKHAR